MAVPPTRPQFSESESTPARRVPVVGVFGGNSLVQLVTRYDTSEAEEQGPSGSRMPPGSSDWSSFEGGGDCQMETDRLGAVVSDDQQR